MNQRSYRDVFIIAGLWAASQLLFYQLYGIRLGGDSGRYISAAENILKGVPLSREQFHYLAYEGMLVPVFAGGGGKATVVIVQCCLALAGALGLYSLGKAVFPRVAGMAAAATFLIHPSIQRWNYYLLTESLATNALIVVTALAVLGKGKGWRIGALLPAAVILALTRPETFFFLLPVSVYLWEGRVSWSTALGVLFFFFGIGLWYVRPGASEGFGIIQQWTKGTYIWGYPGIGPPKTGWSSQQPLTMGGHFWVWLVHDPFWVAKVVLLKLFYFFIPIRPFFSSLHNLAAVVLTLPVFGLAVLGTIRGKKRETLFIWAMILVQGVLVTVTWSDWDNRWLDRVTPLLILLAAGGAFSVWHQSRVKITKVDQ
ncbi:MAG: hypothetical protein HY787_02885 [Deltaproteobacteria bacterium]|nr:hypothetical protein [Deltaproteobacteria bacterium]